MGGEYKSCFEIRCPHCGHIDWADDEKIITCNGNHNVECHFCKRSYTISTSILSSFTSPPMKDETNDNL